MQRHYASDTGSTNKSSRDEPEVVTEADSKPSSRLVTLWSYHVMPFKLVIPLIYVVQN